MQPTLVPRKTARGQEEMRQGRMGLGHGLRRVLIMVDGQRSIGQLLHENAGALDVTGALEQLLQLQLIELPGMATAPSAAAPAHSPRAALEQMAETLLGAKAAQPVVQKLHASNDDAEALAALIEPCARLIKLFIDEAKAADFRQQAAVILGRHGG